MLHFSIPSSTAKFSEVVDKSFWLWDCSTFRLRMSVSANIFAWKSSKKRRIWWTRIHFNWQNDVLCPILKLTSASSLPDDGWVVMTLTTELFVISFSNWESWNEKLEINSHSKKLMIQGPYLYNFKWFCIFHGINCFRIIKDFFFLEIFITKNLLKISQNVRLS